MAYKEGYTSVHCSGGSKYHKKKQNPNKKKKLKNLQ
jgi:hypothetical protein